MSEPASESVHAMLASGRRSYQQKSKPKSSNSKKKSQGKDRKSGTTGGSVEKGKCANCGLQHEANREKNCPAFGRRCSRCQKMNHYARCCKSKSAEVRQIAAEDSDSSYEHLMVITDSESVRAVEESPQYNKQMFATMDLVRGRSVRFQLDTGATCNVIRRADLPPDQKVEPSATTLSLFNQATLRPEGRCKLRFRRKKYEGEFIVVREAPSSILGARSAQQMGLITLHSEVIQEIQLKAPPLTRETVTKEFTAVFAEEKLGCFEGELHLETDSSIPPVQIPIRKPLIAIKPLFKAELDRLEELGVVSKMDTPTDWVSSFVVFKKPSGSLRLCLDPVPLNKALRRSHYPMPTLDDILPELSRARVFSLADVRNGFWHVRLDAESRRLTTFGTSYGRYVWNRMPFGISPAPEVFQRKLQEALEGLEGVHPVADDILIVGEGDTDEEAIVSHDKRLWAFLTRCRERRIQLNAAKFQFRVTQLPYVGHVLTAEGLCPSPRKVQAVSGMPRPQDVHAVRRLIGVATYMAKFIPNLTEICTPLRALTHEGTPWRWTDV